MDVVLLAEVTHNCAIVGPIARQSDDVKLTLFLRCLDQDAMPPPAAAEVTVDRFVELVLAAPEELLPHPAASTAQPSAAAIAAPAFFLCTFTPPTCMTTLGQGREHRCEKR
jgi:hypothetical protein